MDVVTHVATPKPHNIKHPANSWYVVSLEVPERSRNYLGLLQRFTIAVATSETLMQARRALEARREEFAISEIGEIQDGPDSKSFLLCDLNRNWWEVECPKN